MTDIHKLTERPQFTSDEDQDPFILRSGLDLRNEAMLQSLTRDLAQSAFCYARVIEIPTPRWTEYNAVRFNIELRSHIPLTVQKRASTSPIWYTPE